MSLSLLKGPEVTKKVRKQRYPESHAAIVYSAACMYPDQLKKKKLRQYLEKRGVAKSWHSLINRPVPCQHRTLLYSALLAGVKADLRSRQALLSFLPLLHKKCCLTAHHRRVFVLCVFFSVQRKRRKYLTRGKDNFEAFMTQFREKLTKCETSVSNIKL